MWEYSQNSSTAGTTTKIFKSNQIKPLFSSRRWK